jgi:hypothetical protein
MEARLFLASHPTSAISAAVLSSSNSSLRIEARLFLASPPPSLA